jgi:ribosomal protein S18 acetylase RimI-like enzyme
MKMENMNEAEFDAFYEASLAWLFEIRAAETGLSLEEVQPRVEDELKERLPDGLKTPGNYFLNLKLEDGINAGYLWFAVREHFAKRRIFILEIKVLDEYRGNGYSKFMLNWLEEETKRLGFSEIGLHVLGNNRVARNLYEQMGYEPTSLYLAKKI